MVHCGRLPTEQELHAYYDGYPVASLSPITIKRYDELLDRFAPWRRTGRLIDVGCGAGYFLDRAAAKAWAVTGTEYGGIPLATARAKGHAIIEGPLNPADHPGAPFDVACSFEVIEHVTNPADELARMAQVVRPGGLIYVTTPNYRSVGHWLAGGRWSVVNYPEHLNYFTPATLKCLARQQGLRIAWVETTGVMIKRLAQAGSGAASAAQREEAVRQAFEGRWHMRMAKRSINGALTLLGLGDSLKAAFIKPG